MEDPNLVLYNICGGSNSLFGYPKEPDNSVEIAKEALENGADIEKAGSGCFSCYTPLELAVCSGYVNLVEFLIERGAKITKDAVRWADHYRFKNSHLLRFEKYPIYYRYKHIGELLRREKPSGLEISPIDGIIIGALYLKMLGLRKK